MSLRLRALLILWSIEGGTFLIIILASSGYLYRDGIGDIERRARETALLLRSILIEPMLLDNPASASEIASNVFYDLPAIDRIKVQNNEGEVLAFRQRGHDITSDRHILVSAPVFLGETCFGIIDITYSTEWALADAREHAWVLSSFALFGMASSGLLTWLVTTRLVGTLRELSEGVTAIADGEMPAQEIKYNRDNELGRLVDNYNRLVENLHYGYREVG